MSTRMSSEPLITCLLPELDEKHQWQLILQYLQENGFNHTASAFTLELHAKGIKGDDLEALPKEDLRKHMACFVARQALGPSAPAAVVLPRSSAGAPAANQAGKGSKASQQKRVQQDTEEEGKNQQQAGAVRSHKAGHVSPMDIDQRHPQRLDQTEHDRRHSRQLQQSAAPSASKAAAAEQPKQQEATSDGQHVATSAGKQQVDVQQQQQRQDDEDEAHKSAACHDSAADAAGAAVVPQPAAPAPAAVDDSALEARAESAEPAAAAAAATAPAVNVSRLTSATGEGDDTLDFGDGEEEEAAPAGELEEGEDPGSEAAAAAAEQEHVDDEQQLQETGKAGEAARHEEHEEQPNAAVQQQPSRVRAPTSETRSQLKRGRVSSPAPRQGSSDGKRARSPSSSHRRGHSSSRSRSHGRSRSHSRSRSYSSHSRSRSHSHSSRSRSSRERRRSYSRSRSGDRGRSRSRSRGFDSHSRSRSRGYRDKQRSSRSHSHSHSRSLDRDRTRSRSKSRDWDRDRNHGDKQQRGGYQQQQQRWQGNRQGGPYDMSSRGGRAGTYHANGTYSRGGLGRGNFVSNRNFDGPDRRGSGDFGAAGNFSSTNTRGRGRGRFVSYDMNSRGGGRGYQAGRGRHMYPNAHNTPREGDEGYHPPEHPHGHVGSDEGADGHHMAGSGGVPVQHHGSPSGGAAGGSAGERADTGPLRTRSLPDSDDARRYDFNSRDRPGVYSFRGRGRGRLGAGRPPPGPEDHHYQSPTADVVLHVEPAGGASSAPAPPPKDVPVGKEGGKYDWPPRDPSGKPILGAVPPAAAVAAAAGGDRFGSHLGPRKLSLPEERGHWGGSGGRGPARERFVQPGRRPSLTLKSGLVVGDLPDDGAAGDGYNIDHDRWRADEDERISRGSGSRSRSHGASPRRWESGGGGGGDERWDGAEGDRDGGHIKHHQQQQRQQPYRSSDAGGSGARDGRDSSPGNAAAAAAPAAAGNGAGVAAAVAAAAEAAAGVSGAQMVAKRRISHTGTAIITDLSANSHDSPHRAGSPISTAAVEDGGPAKKARASSPGS